MASAIFNSTLTDIVSGNIDFAVDSFKMMLVTSAYSPDVDAHNRRDDITNEVSGTGYTILVREIARLIQDMALMKPPHRGASERSRTAYGRCFPPMIFRRAIGHSCFVSLA